MTREQYISCAEKLIDCAQRFLDAADSLREEFDVFFTDELGLDTRDDPNFR